MTSELWGFERGCEGCIAGMRARGGCKIDGVHGLRVSGIAFNLG
jgi:hypothetical protein